MSIALIYICNENYVLYDKEQLKGIAFSDTE